MLVVLTRQSAVGEVTVVDEKGFEVPLRLGIDIVCRAAHQVSLADDQGRFLWSGRRFRTTPGDLTELWAMLPDGTDPAQVLVVMEPTRNAWVPLAAWFRRKGARVVLVPPERSADLRNYYAKHVKTDRLDSQLLARLPMLHPEGLHLEEGFGPADALKRGAKLHSTLPIAARSRWLGWTRCWRSSGRPGTPRSGRIWPTAPRCDSSRPVTPTRTPSDGSAALGSPASSTGTPAGHGATNTLTPY